MDLSIRDRARSEGGFTLIELLVVMIIIAILMAVAVPTFLGQKQNAQATKAKANIKQIVTAIESCAVSNTGGSYISPRTCLTPATVIGDEPTLGGVLTGTGATPTEDTCSIYNPTSTGYGVACSYIGDGGVKVSFTEEHTGTGAINKNCTGTSKACPAGLPANKMW